MATSSKVQFSLETLKMESLKSIQSRIEAARNEVEAYSDQTMLAGLISEWRIKQEERLLNFASRIREVSDHELAGFRVQSIPNNDDRYEKQRASRVLRDLEELEIKIRAKSESLVADEDGNISLTKTQLQEFFGL